MDKQVKQDKEINEVNYKYANLFYEFNKLPDNIILLSFQSKDIEKCMYIINQILFYTTPDDRFISITSYKDEFSILVTKDIIESYLTTKLDNFYDYDRYGKRYTAFQIIENSTELSKIGIISSLAFMMSNSGIPILYNSTYSNDYILVEYEYTELAEKLLQENLKTI